MILYEYESKKILQFVGIPIPDGFVISSVIEARQILDRIEWPAVIKPQVPIGGRMKAGGIYFVEDPDEIMKKVTDLLGSSLKGHEVKNLLIEKKMIIEKEYYLAITYDRLKKSALVILSSEGGINIEETKDSSSRVIKYYFNFSRLFPEYKGRELASELGLSGSAFLSLGNIICRLARAFYEFDATIIEINPLVKVKEGDFVAVDAHIDIDDAALFRHPELKEKFNISLRESTIRKPTSFEKDAAKIDSQDHRGVAGRVVEFNGNLGLLIGGGGASITVFDAILKYGGKPANYCEIGGNPSVRKLKDLTRLIISRPGVDNLAIIMNVISNTRVDLIARGVIKGIIESGYSPKEKIAVFRVPGAWEEEGYKILRKYGIEYYDRTVSIDQAAKEAVLKAG